MGTVGVVDVKVQASTNTATADIESFGSALGKTAAKAKEASAKVDAALGKMTIAAQKAQFAALMASDRETSALRVTAAARERYLRAWEKEKLAQDRAAETATAVARANELAAMKADMLASANERLGDSTVPVITKFRVMSNEIRESMAGVGETMAATAERAELSADGIASAFGGLGKLIGVGIAGDMAAHMLDNFAELNVRLDDLHEKTGVAVQDLAGLRLAALSKGLDFETIGMGLTRLGKAMYEAKQGMLEDREAFTTLGISMKEVNTLSVEQMFYRISKALGENKSLAIADGTALELFGRGGKELIPILREWGGNLQNIVNQQSKLTGVTNESGAAAKKWLLATTDLSAQLHGDLAPVLIGLSKHLGAIEAAGRGVMEVFLEMGGVAVASFETIVNAIHGPAAAMDDLMHGRFSAAAADSQNFAAKIRQDWRDVGNVLHDNETKIMQDWAASGKLPKVNDVPDQNGTGDVDGALLKAAKQDLANRERKHALTQAQLITFWKSYLAKAKPGSTDYEQINVMLGNVMQRSGAGAAAKAAKAQMEAWKQNLEDRKAAHAMSLGEEAEYWLRAASMVKFGSKNYLEALYNANRAMAELRAQTARSLAQFTDTANAPTEPEDLGKKYERYLSQQGRAAVQYLQNLNAGVEIQRENADAMAESSLQMEVATGRMSRYDAAVMAARLHTQEYAQSMADLREALAAIPSEGLTEIEGKEKAAGIANQMAQLKGQRSVQAMQDIQGIRSQSLGSASRQALDEMVASWTDMTEQLRDLLPNALANIDESLSHALMARAYNGQEYRRGIEQGLSNSARGVGSQLLNTGFHKVEGEFLSKLGFGPKAKLGETESSAMWVRIAQARVGGGAAGALDVIKDFSGQSSGLSTTSKTVGSLIPSLLSIIPGFADGGVIPSNSWSIVGERGIELLPPVGQPRTVIPNDQIGGMGGTHFHMPISVDARGAHDPAAVEAAAHRAVTAAAPQIVAAAVHVVHEGPRRKPSTVR